MIAEWMTPEPIVVDVDTSVRRCRSILEDGRIRHLPVVEGGWLLGVLDAVDVQGASDEARAGDLPVRRVPTARPDASLLEVVEALRDTDGDVVVIVEQGTPVGLFTEHDAVRLGARLLDEDLSIEPYATHPVATIDACATASEARSRFERQVQRHLVVLHEGKLYAALSRRDVVNERPTALVSECVRPVQWRITWSTPLREAARIMAKNHIGLLPIIDAAGDVRGVLSRTDIIVALAEYLEAGNGPS